MEKKKETKKKTKMKKKEEGDWHCVQTGQDQQLEYLRRHQQIHIYFK